MSTLLEQALEKVSSLPPEEQDMIASQIVDTLADEARIGTEHQHDRARGIRARDEGFDVGGFQGDHISGVIPAERSESRDP